MDLPNYTITVFFLGGSKTVIHCLDYAYKTQWLILNVPEDDDKTAIVHFNKDIIEKWLVQEFDPVAVAKQLEEAELLEQAKAPPPPEGPPNQLLKEGDTSPLTEG
ncbi:hypothetical protein LCGC14_1337270 [marine sediment metagenome]|uniref:Uncharacterized protein n=1 Tax=marine sediment metagenome TaxID=412755 RepID=A0A0F9KEM0_9ZZZZ